MRGEVKTIRADRGFGFIRCEDGGADVFLHVRDVDPSVPFDDTLLNRRVEFGITQSDKGRRAVDVRLA